MPDADQRRRETEAKPRAGTVRQMKAAVQMEEMPKEGADSGPNRADTGSRMEKGAEGRPARNRDEDEADYGPGKKRDKTLPTL
ncbi:MAG: hypothetical protein ACLR0U_30430 [Enterocloster clostridioformis]